MTGGIGAIGRAQPADQDLEAVPKTGHGAGLEDDGW